LSISKPNKEINLFIKEAVFLDMDKKKVIHNVFFESGKDDENLSTLSDFIIEKVLFNLKFRDF
jgi:hypothetical protein